MTKAEHGHERVLDTAKWAAISDRDFSQRIALACAEKRAQRVGYEWPILGVLGDLPTPNGTAFGLSLVTDATQTTTNVIGRP